ncbi:NUDIX hydrolase [Chloroherpeton thalassium]|nr:NUDIX domain-containing protein [Chloroherpeton thalassium]
MFKYCPNCSSETVEFDGLKKYECASCGWTFYRNAATAVMAVLRYQGKILFAIRAKAPALGKLDCPGGFVDPGENAETALARELQEELGLSGLCYEFLGTAINSYEYKNIVYPTCDLIFTAELEKIPHEIDPSEISGIGLLALEDVQDSELSFPSVQKALQLYAARFGNSKP